MLTPIADTKLKAWPDARAQAALINEICACATLDQNAYETALRESAHDDRHAAATAPLPGAHMASNTASFLSVADNEHIEAAIEAIEAATRLPAYRQAALGNDHAALDFGTAGAFMGYDFHITDSGPKLIEINTNAGGAFLNDLILQSQHACCTEFHAVFSNSASNTFADDAFNMFVTEWRKQRGPEKQLKRLAIIDETPENQPLYAELLLAKRLFEQRGVEALIVDPNALSYDGGALMAGTKKIDLVYNRLTDFSISDPNHATLANAYKDGAVVLTPAPHHHALYASKKNMAWLSNASLMRSWGLNEAQTAALDVVVPETVIVTQENSDALWRARKKYYFKPVSGYGSKAVYRGRKLTKTKWAVILKGDYVAQEYVKPADRLVMINNEPSMLKMDVRFYTYCGRTLLKAARLYQGQTTNFRTAGGGFSPVLLWPWPLDRSLRNTIKGPVA